MWISINMRKISLSHLFIFQIQSVLESHHHTRFFIWSSQNIFNYLLICVNLYQHAKNQVSPSVHSWDTQSIWSPEIWLATPIFWPCPTKTLYEQLSIFMNLHQHAKNEAVSSICSREIVDFKILLSDWLRVFWPISHEQDFSQI